MKNLKLTIELVPKSCWFSNVRDHVSNEQWDIIKKNSYKKSNYKCSICNGKGEQHPVECHEIWNYDDINNIQKLEDCIALCPNCHQVKHIGFAKISGNLDSAIQHFMKINMKNKEETIEYIKNVFNIWKKRSKKQWKLDLKWLNENYDFNINEKR